MDVNGLMRSGFTRRQAAALDTSFSDIADNIAIPQSSVYRGAWYPAYSYVVGDLISYGSGLWVALAPSYGATPVDTPAPTPAGSNALSAESAYATASTIAHHFQLTRVAEVIGFDILILNAYLTGSVEISITSEVPSGVSTPALLTPVTTTTPVDRNAQSNGFVSRFLLDDPFSVDAHAEYYFLIHQVANTDWAGQYFAQSSVEAYTGIRERPDAGQGNAYYDLQRTANGSWAYPGANRRLVSNVLEAATAAAWKKIAIR